MNFWRKIFNKPSDTDDIDVDYTYVIPNSKFAITIENMTIGYLESKHNKWYFYYSEAFRNQDLYHRIVGFSNLNKVYEAELLWPFFKVRIPGLKQPLIQKIIKSENIDETNEVDLLKRFGRNNVTNPYILDVV